MSKRPTLLQHFRSFAFQNNIKDFEKALEYFTVFGGTGWDIDTSKSVNVLIKEKVLCNYEPIHKGIIRFTHGNALYHLLLSHIALGENNEETLLKKVRVGKDKGEEAMDYLEMKSLLKFDNSIEKPLKSSDAKDKVFFELPFMRFWFAMVSPFYKSISKGDFSEFEIRWHQLSLNFSILLSNFLVLELAKETFSIAFANDPIVSIGSYYDKKVQIKILAKRKSGKMLAGECKYSTKEANSNMLNLLKEKCQKVELEISDYVLFSKNGFSSELLERKEENIKFLSHKNLSSLLDNLTKKDLLVYKNKKY